MYVGGQKWGIGYTKLKKIEQDLIEWKVDLNLDCPMKVNLRSDALCGN